MSAGLPVHDASAQDGDRSVPRSRVREGDRSIDRRGRRRAAPAALSYGFRPFFLGAALYAATAIPLWLVMLATGFQPAGAFAGAALHAHEMIFGYLGAVLAGFILTAVPNWTGRLPLSGLPLAALFAMWVMGRVSCWAVSDPLTAAVIDLAFPVALQLAVWREVVAGRNWRNAPVAVLLTLFAVANLLHHLFGLWAESGAVAVRIALGVAALLMTLIGGRIVPSFTRNWLVRQGAARLPASFGRLDRIAIMAVAAGALAWVASPGHVVTGALLMAAGALLCLRLLRWHGVATWREPIVLILHVGYGWIALALMMLGGTALWPASVPADAALHALTVGAVGTMTLAVMTRATLGHTGRTIRTDAATLSIYAAVTAGALLRVLAPFFAGAMMPLLEAGGIAWSLAFGLFVLRYGPMLLSPRASERS